MIASSNPSKTLSAGNQSPSYIRQIEVNNQPKDIIIKRSRRKTMALHIFIEKPIELRVPLKCPWREIDNFLESRLSWIEKSLTELESMPPVPSLRYFDGAQHLVLGTPTRLLLNRGMPSSVNRIQGDLVVCCAEPSNEHKVANLLDGWYREQALLLLPERIEVCLQRFTMSQQPTGLRVRKMKARWGSCSRHGEICLNSLLLRYPEEAIDFVITHELCHLSHFAHNKAFYKLLTQVMPDWREREKLLER